MSGERAAEFVQMFNQTVEHLRKVTGLDKGVSFPQMLAIAARKDPVVRRHAIRLREYGDLRNAIVHHSSYPEEVIADPTEETMARFRGIVQNLTAPKLLLPMFRKAIKCFSPDDRLADALALMRENDYAQVVVRDGGILALLTSRGVARWLEKHGGSDAVTLKDVRVQEALEFEGRDICMIMAGTNTVDEAQQAFVDAITRKKRWFFAIIITENGKPEEEPAGIVTPGDLLGVVES